MGNGNYKLRYVCRLNRINCKLCKLCKLYSAKNSEKTFIRTYTVSIFVYETRQILQTVCTVENVGIRRFGAEQALWTNSRNTRNHSERNRIDYETSTGLP